MKNFIIDANIIFSGVLSRKAIYKTLFSDNICYTPDFALLEIQKYRQVILKKSKADLNSLKEFTLFIFSKLSVLPDYIISENYYHEALRLCQDIDVKDA